MFRKAVSILHRNVYFEDKPTLWPSVCSPSSTSEFTGCRLVGKMSITVWLGKCLLLWAHTHRRYFNSKTFPQWKAWLPSRREVVGQTLNDVAKNTKEPMGAMISHTIYGMCQTASTQVATTFSPYQILSTREESFLVNILTLSN